MGAKGELRVHILVYRERRGTRRDGTESKEPSQTKGNKRLELLWTAIPKLILAGIAVPTVASIFELADCPDGAMEIQIIGHQWWFEYNYPDSGIVTANVMVIPADTEICAKMTSTDVIHNYWIPKLSGKRYLVPGREPELRLYASDPGEDWGNWADF